MPKLIGAVTVQLSLPPSAALEMLGPHGAGLVPVLHLSESYVVHDTMTDVPRGTATSPSWPLTLMSTVASSSSLSLATVQPLSAGKSTNPSPSSSMPLEQRGPGGADAATKTEETEECDEDAGTDEATDEDREVADDDNGDSLLLGAVHCASAGEVDQSGPSFAMV